MNFWRSKVEEKDMRTIHWLTPSGERSSVTVEAKEREDGWTVSSPVAAPAGRTVWVDGEEALTAFVRSCQASGTGYVLELGLLTQDRRREGRIPASGAGILCWYDSKGRRESIVSVDDVTENGTRVTSPELLPETSMVRLCGETWEFLGRVRYCKPVEMGFAAGIEMASPAYRKDSQDYCD